MRAALLILRKDMHRFRAHLGAYLVVTASYAYMDAALPAQPQLQVFGIVGGILVMALAGYLAVAVVFEERLPGDTQHWLTRPISGAQILLSKLLFLALFFHVPVLVSQAVALAANGLSPFTYATPLVANQFFLAAWFTLPVVALAAVTTGYAQLAMGAIGVLAAFIAEVFAAGSSNWGGMQWILDSCLGAVAMLALATALFFAYRRRRPIVARWILGGGAALMVAITYLDPWAPALAFEMRLAGQGAGEPVRIALAAAHDGAAAVSANRLFEADHDMVEIDLPIAVTGIPEGMEAVEERIEASIDSDGAHWSSGWCSAGGLVGIRERQTFPTANRASTIPASPSKIPDNGDYWLRFYVNHRYFLAVKDGLAHLHARAAMTLLGTPATTELPLSTENRFLPEIGFCWLNPARVTCFSPPRHAAAIDVLFRHLSSGEIENWGVDSQPDYGPFSTGPRLSAWEADINHPLPPGAAQYAAVFQARQVAASFVRELDIPQIRLALYAGVDAEALR